MAPKYYTMPALIRIRYILKSLKLKVNNLAQAILAYLFLVPHISKHISKTKPKSYNIPKVTIIFAKPYSIPITNNNTNTPVTHDNY